MSNEALKKLDDALQRLDKLDEILNLELRENKILKKKVERLEELEKFYQVTYETAKKHKEIKEKYERECGTLPSTEGSGSRNNE